MGSPNDDAALIARSNEVNGSPFRLFPHQVAAIQELRKKVGQGKRRLVLVIPTGGGKSYCIGELAWLATKKGKSWLVISNRKVVHERLSRLFRESEISLTMIDAELPRRGGYWRRGHIAMLQTLASRHLHQAKNAPAPVVIGELPPADLVIFDEAHLNRAATAVAIIEHYVKLGAVVIGPTATPVGVGKKVLAGQQPLYQDMVQSGTNTKLVECGLLVNGDCYAPDEPDLKGVRLASSGDFPEIELDRRFRTNRFVVVGRILEHYERINPDHRPTLIFAPSVLASQFLAEQFTERYGRGFARHIDGQTPNGIREEILTDIQSADPLCRVICNYGVAEVGLDCPILSHLILVRTFGRPSTYIQACGRVKRAIAGKAYYTLQDHSGSIWRHGHPDTDWSWRMEFTDGIVRRMREWKLRRKPELQEIICPACQRVRIGGDVCPGCGDRRKMSVRTIIERDGRLVMVRGPAFKPIKRATPEKAWKNEVWAGIVCDRTVLQAVERYRHKNPGMALPASIPAGPQAMRKLRTIYPDIARIVAAKAARYQWSTKGGAYKAKRKR